MLFDRLKAAGPGEVILACAPAGSGKTVLLRSWVESEGSADRTAWVSVARGERDAQHFWLSVIDDLAGAVGEDGLVERVGASPAFDGHAVVDRLLSDLRSLEQPVVLVIDDLHELRSEEALPLLERLPDRAAPEAFGRAGHPRGPAPGIAPAATDRWTDRGTRARSALLTGGDPRAAGGDRHQLSDEGVRCSTSAPRVGGGPRLAAISLASHPDPERFVAEFSGSEHTVAGYLLAEVLERQPSEVRDLLLRTSVLERVSGPLADALTGGTGSEEMLQTSRTRTRSSPLWTWVGPGFATTICSPIYFRLELRRADPAMVGPLHRSAAQWFEEHGYVVDAVRHAQAAGDGRTPPGYLPTTMSASCSTGTSDAPRAADRVPDRRARGGCRAGFGFRDGAPLRRPPSRERRGHLPSRSDWPGRSPRSGGRSSTYGWRAPAYGWRVSAAISRPRSRRWGLSKSGRAL